MQIISYHKKGDTKPKCTKKNFKGRMIETCSAQAPAQLQHLTTAGFPTFTKGKLMSSYTFLTGSDPGSAIRFIIEVIDIDCEAGFGIISEGEDKSQKLCSTGVQYPNVVGRKNNLKISLTVNNPTVEYRIKIGFQKGASKCGKIVKGFPRSPDPCQEPDIVDKVDNGSEAENAMKSKAAGMSWRFRQAAKNSANKVKYNLR